MEEIIQKMMVVIDAKYQQIVNAIKAKDEQIRQTQEQINKLIAELDTNSTGTQESVVKLSIEQFDSDTEL